MTIDSYSAFNENDRITRTGLTGYLRERGLGRIFLTGLAYDFCVRHSAIDSMRAGFETYVVEDACRAISLGDSVAATNHVFHEAGVRRITSAMLDRLDSGRVLPQSSLAETSPFDAIQSRYIGCPSPSCSSLKSRISRMCREGPRVQQQLASTPFAKSAARTGAPDYLVIEQLKRQTLDGGASPDCPVKLSLRFAETSCSRTLPKGSHGFRSGKL